MRKKSHIDLAKYILNSYSECKYRKIMYFGSILPDLVPTFIYKRHRIDVTLGIVRKEIEKVIEQDYESRMYCLRLGIISHYISDYFTLPHNKEFVGSIKEHCSYEKELIFRLRDQIRESDYTRYEVFKNKLSVNDIIEYLNNKHDEYIRKVLNENHTIEDDCSYIISVDLIIVQLIQCARAYEFRRKHADFIGEAILQTCNG